ncbi:MAG: hypothetical protein K9L22_02020 [Methylococcaceae bacterium]|nr:hypothetical protein [Methylococcaceae bacterium]
MRLVIAFLLFGFVQSIQAITKCEFNGKVTYKKGDCPEKAETRFLVKNKYIKEQDLQAFRQERILASEKSLEQIVAPKVNVDDSLEPARQEEAPKKIKMSNESLHFQLQKVEEPNKTGKIYSPDRSDDLRGKLLDMERQVQERNKALQQLQKN